MPDMLNDRNFTDFSSQAIEDSGIFLRPNNIHYNTSDDNTTIAITSCNPAEIIPRLIKTYKKRTKSGLVGLLCLAFILFSTTAGCLLLLINRGGIISNTIEIIICISTLTFSSVIPLFLVFLTLHTLHYGYVWMHDALRIIQLNETTWHDQTESLQENIPKSVIDAFDFTVHSRFRKRPYGGHIILAKEGFIIDDIIAFRYDTYIVSNVDFIYNATETRWIIQVVLVASDLLDCKRDENGYALFNVDLYMPSYVQLQEVIDIRDIILSNSRKYLLHSDYHNKSRITGKKTH